LNRRKQAETQNCTDIKENRKISFFLPGIEIRTLDYTSSSLVTTKVKVNQSCYRSGVAQKVPGS